MQTPCLLSQVSTERISTLSIGESSISCATFSVISSPAATIRWPVAGCMISCTDTRPKIRSDRVEITSSPFFRAVQTSPRSVPQSSSLIITSCDTSTRRRVRYPASAVFMAVSARPLRAPWVEMKYSSTDIPSLKFERIGFSIICAPSAPAFCGFAISPRIPESWRIWSLEPRAPESSIINTALNPWSASVISFISTLPRSLFTCVHVSITWL